MTKFRIISDTHLEFHKRVATLERYIEWSEDDKTSHLLLAGDIGWCFTNRKKKGPICYKPHQYFIEFLLMLKTRFLSVTFITGNHEYYVCRSHDRTMDEVDDKMRDCRARRC